MKLSKWLTDKGVTSPEFARRIKVSVHAVHKWRRGARIPRPEQMSAIARATHNAVGPGDFYKVHRK